MLGDEELLVARAAAGIVAAARAQDRDTDARELSADQLDLGTLYDLLSPSLFAERRVVVILRGQDARPDIVEVIAAYAADPSESISLVVGHAGGAKGKALLAALRSAGAAVVDCKRLTRPEDRITFVRSEVARSGGTIGAAAAAALLDAVGNDLRELSAAADQLAADSGGHIDETAVTRYHRGRAEVSGFSVADRAVVGDVAGALQMLRWALAVGVAHVLIADALADGIRTIARVSASTTGASRRRPEELASSLGMPPWKVKRAMGQARGWSEPGLARALGIVARVNADVKGAAADPSYALEQGIRWLAWVRRDRG